MSVLDVGLAILAVLGAGGFLFWKLWLVPRRRRPLPEGDRVVLGPSLKKGLEKARTKPASSQK